MRSVTSPEDITLKRTASSKLRVFIDNVANKRTTYIYDEYGYLKEKNIGAVSESVTEKDSLGRVTKTVFAVNGGYSNDNAVEYENNHSNAIKNETITNELKKLGFSEIKISISNAEEYSTAVCIVY